MSRPIIEISNLSKSYRLGTIGATSLKEEWSRMWEKLRGRDEPEKKGEFWALREVSFAVQPGEVVGIIGRNGAGKSTLLKILSHITQQTSGTVTLRGRVASLLEVGTGFHPDLTGRENVFLNGAILGMTKVEIRKKLDEIVAFAEVEKFIDTPVKRYSSGMYVRLAFAVAAHLEPEILIVDEVLAVGDAQFQNKCLGKMQDVSKQDGRTVLFVSHNESAIRRLCTHAVLLERGSVAHIGSPQETFRHYRGQEKSHDFSTSNRIHSSKYLRIVSAALAVDGVVSSTVLPSVQPELRLKLEVFEPITASFEVLLRDANSAPIMFGPVGLVRGSKYELKPGCYAVSFQLKLPHLAGGRYSMDLMVVESGVQFFDYLEEAITFTALAENNATTGWSFAQSRGQGCILLHTSLPHVAEASPEYQLSHAVTGSELQALGNAMNQSDFEAPKIDSVPDVVQRPLWSVMIPAFNCAAYLRQTLESVLAQDPGPDQMQIEVVDDCSTKDNPEDVVREVGKGRVIFYRKPKNEGAVENFNTCIRRSRGHLVHILHGDDYVLPGFYEKLGAAANRCPDTALFATRSFYVDEESVIFYASERVRELETGAQAVDRFFYGTPIQTPSVVVRRAFYETHGGFIVDLIHAADCEMWSRAVYFGGGLVLREVLACYRIFSGNDTSRLLRTGENLRDLERLHTIFTGRYSGFDQNTAKRRICDMARDQANRFTISGDAAAAKANGDYWRRNAPLSWRLQWHAQKAARRLFW